MSFSEKSEFYLYSESTLEPFERLMPLGKVWRVLDDAFKDNRVKDPETDGLLIKQLVTEGLKKLCLEEDLIDDTLVESLMKNYKESRKAAIDEVNWMLEARKEIADEGAKVLIALTAMSRLYPGIHPVYLKRIKESLYHIMDKIDHANISRCIGGVQDILKTTNKSYEQLNEWLSKRQWPEDKQAKKENKPRRRTNKKVAETK